MSRSVSVYQIKLGARGAINSNYTKLQSLGKIDKVRFVIKIFIYITGEQNNIVLGV